MADDINKEVMVAVKELRETVEKHGTASAEYKAQAEKMDGLFAEQEAKNQKIVADLAEERKAREDFADRVKELEAAVADATTRGSEKNYKDTAEYKALQSFVQKGAAGVDTELKASLRMDDSTQGGYLTSHELDTAIIKKITEISPVRSVARVRTVSKKTLELPSRQSIPTAQYEGELEQNTESTSTYGNETITAFRLSVTVPYSIDLLMDSNFDLESEIRSDVGEAFAKTEGNKFILGTGVKQPEGFLVNTAVVANTATTAGASGVLAADDLISLTGDLKTGYNPMYAFNRRTLAEIRQFKGTNGQYLWQSGLAGGAPNTIAGDPYVIMEDMPDVAAGAKAVMYADFMRGYRIIDRTGMAIVRDEYTQARNAQILLTFHRWNSGQVVLPEAFKLLTIKA
jgi:HK97 family phage major capsid protein